MTILRHEFHQQADKPAKYPSPFSLRLTYAEKAQLLAEAGRKSLGVYIRERLFGKNAAPRKRHGNSPVS